MNIHGRCGFLTAPFTRSGRYVTHRISCVLMLHINNILAVQFFHGSNHLIIRWIILYHFNKSLSGYLMFLQEHFILRSRIYVFTDDALQFCVSFVGNSGKPRYAADNHIPVTRFPIKRHFFTSFSNYRSFHMFKYEIP